MQETLIGLVNYCKDKEHALDMFEIADILRKYVERVVKPVWGIAAQIEVMTETPGFGWMLGFFDNADQSDILGYHDITEAGFPLGKVFIDDSIKADGNVLVTASHEIGEMLLDPALNYFIMEQKTGYLHALEIADPTEETFIMIDGKPTSNIVTPEWYEGFHKEGTKRFDFLGLIKNPFELLPGGYSIIIKDGEFDTVTGSEEKAERFKTENRKGHRSEYRKSKVLSLG